MEVFKFFTAKCQCCDNFVLFCASDDSHAIVRLFDTEEEAKAFFGGRETVPIYMTVDKNKVLMEEKNDGRSTAN